MSRSEVCNPRVADRLHPLWDQWPTQHPEHSPFGGSPPRRPKLPSHTAAGFSTGFRKLQESFLAQSWQPGNFRPSIFTCPKYFWAKTWAISLFDPRSIPEASPLSLQSSSHFFESSQGRWPWQLHRIYDSGLTTPKLRHVMMHLGLDARNVQKIMDSWMGINPTRINQKVRLQRGLGMEHSSCSTRCTR